MRNLPGLDNQALVSRILGCWPLSAMVLMGGFSPIGHEFGIREKNHYFEQVLIY